MTLTQVNKAGLDELALDHVFTIGASGTDHYTFQGEGLNGTVNDPTLYLIRGKTYRFENTTGGHPIRIQSTSGASGTAYNTGVTNNASAGTVIVEVQHDAPDVLYYQCTSHANMNGILYITGALADGGVNTAKLSNNAVTTDKIADDAVTNAKIGAGAVGTGEIADNAILSNKIAANQVTNAEIATTTILRGNMANNSVGTTEILDEAVTLAKLEHGTSSNNGKFLRANNGADPTFETVNTDLVSDTSPQLGGDLDSNGNNIKITDGEQLRLGDGNDFTLEHTGTLTKVLNESSRLIISGSASDNVDIMKTQSEYMAKFIPDGAVELYHDGTKKFETTSDGVKIDSGLLEVNHSSCHIDLMETGTTNHRIRNGSGNFHIQKLSDDKNTSTTQFVVDGGTGAVELYYNGTKTVETKALNSGSDTHQHGLKFWKNKAIQFHNDQIGIFTFAFSMNANTWTTMFSHSSYVAATIHVSSVHNAGFSSATWIMSKSASGGNSTVRTGHNNAYSPANLEVGINSNDFRIRSSYGTYGYGIVLVQYNMDGIHSISS